MPSGQQKAPRVKKTPRSAERILLNVELAKRDLRLSDLAYEIDVPPANLRVEATNGFPSRPLRARIEAFLDLAIWSAPSEHRRNRKLADLLGVNPGTVTVRQLRSMSKKCGFAGYGHIRSRTEFINRLTAFLSVNKEKRQLLRPSESNEP
jgi:hypothetical protein